MPPPDPEITEDPNGDVTRFKRRVFLEWTYIHCKKTMTGGGTGDDTVCFRLSNEVDQSTGLSTGTGTWHVPAPANGLGVKPGYSYAPPTATVARLWHNDFPTTGGRPTITVDIELLETVSNQSLGTRNVEINLPAPNAPVIKELGAMFTVLLIPFSEPEGHDYEIMVRVH